MVDAGFSTVFSAERPAGDGEGSTAGVSRRPPVVTPDPGGAWSVTAGDSTRHKTVRIRNRVPDINRYC